MYLEMIRLALKPIASLTIYKTTNIITVRVFKSTRQEDFSYQKHQLAY
jgi:hypothetical protein